MILLPSSICQFALLIALVFATFDIVKGSNDTFERRTMSLRRQLKYNSRADTAPADTNLYTSPRETLAFNDGFNLISSIPNVHFSLMHMSQRTPHQMDEKSWAPGLHPDSGVQPFSIFFNACMNTAAGKRFQAAQSGRLDRGYSAWLIMLYGTFNTKYGSFDAWDWKQDGNMVVSCQYARILRGKADGSQKQIPITDFEVVLESSRKMIANMKTTYKLNVDYVGMPARNRKQLEAIKLHQQPGHKP